MLKRLIIWVFILPAYSVVDGAVIRTSSSGLWSDPASWISGTVPSVNDQVVIQQWHSITVDVNTTFAKLTVENNAKITLQPAIPITINGGLIVNGIFNMNQGNINFPVQGSVFQLGPGSEFIWDPGSNTEASASLFVNGLENFDPASHLIIKKWFDYYATPLGSLVSSNFGNLTLNSKNGNAVFEWNQKNMFQIRQIMGTLTIDQGWITLDKSGTITQTNIGKILLASPNSYLLFHNGNHSGSFSVYTNEIINNGGNIWGLYNGNGNINLSVTGNFINKGNIKLVFNDGIAAVGNGNASLNVGGTFNQTSGDFRGIYNITTTNSGIFDLTFNNLELSGGIFFGQYGIHTAGLVSSLTVNKDMLVQFNSALDKFRGCGLTNISSFVNNSQFKLIVNGNLDIKGNQNAELTSSASSGKEEVNCNGNVMIEGCQTNFNYGSFSAAHDIDIKFSGSFTLAGGTVYLSRLSGKTSILIEGAINLLNGILTLKGADGLTDFISLGNFMQQNGSLYLKNNPSLISTLPVECNFKADFRQTGGNIIVDNHTSGGVSHIINLSGENIDLGGSASISRLGNGSHLISGAINYNRNGGITFKRSLSHKISLIKQTIANKCVVDVIGGGFQVASFSTSGTDFLSILPGGSLRMRDNTISSNSEFGFCGIRLETSGTLALQHINGLYNGTTNACINSSGNMNFYLDANSVIEYCGNENQIVTGIGQGQANSLNHKYGILEINKSQETKLNTAMLNGLVHVRSRLRLTDGELYLNGKTLVLENGSNTSINRINGYIKCESNVNEAQGIFQWQLLSSGTKTIPFGYDKNLYLPVTIQVLSGAGNTLSSSTWRTTRKNHPLPVTSVSGPVTGIIINGADVSQTEIIDRWWNFSGSGIRANISLTYAGEENTINPTLQNGNLSVISWQPGNWTFLAGGGSGVNSGTGKVTALNTSLLSAWTVSSSSAPLPVEYLYFDVFLVDQKAELKWGTGSELNNDYFNVERSSDGKKFHTLTKLNGAGNSQTTNKYSFTDHQPLRGVSYYRITQVDYNGGEKFSEIRSIFIGTGYSNSAIDLIQLTPNPFKTGFTIRYKVNEDSNVKFELYNLAGNMVHKESKIVNKGVNAFEFNKGDLLTPGVYIAKLETPEDKITEKLIKN